MQFRLILKDTNEKAYHLFFWFLFCLHVLVAGVFALRISNQNTVTGCYIFIGLYLFVLTFFWVLRKRQDIFKYSVVVYLLHISLWVLLSGYIALLIVVLLILFTEVIRKRKTFILFSKEEIIFQYILSSKKYCWQQMDNVILKDGLLTVDFKNNHLLQVEAIQDGDAFSETQFNDFCKSLIIHADF